MGTGRPHSLPPQRLVWACRLALLVGSGGHALWLLAWVAADGRVAPQVCCDLSDPVVDVALMSPDLRAAGWPWSVLNRGAMSWAAWALGRATGPHIDTLLWVQVGALALSQGALFWLLRPLSGPRTALLAALLLPVVPGVAFASRQWDPYTLQGLVLLLAAGALVRSRSLTRLGWALLFGALGWLGAVMSPLLTDDLLALLAWGCLGAAAALRGLLWGRDAWGARVSRLRVAAGGLLALLTSLAMLRSSAAYRGDLAQHLSYYAVELGAAAPPTGEAAPAYTWLADARSLPALATYLRRLLADELGPLLGGAALLGVGRLLWRRAAGRAELLAGLLGLPLLLSLVAKKQAFYIYPCLPFVPAVVLAALAAPGGRLSRPAGVVGGLLLLLVGGGTLQRSLSHQPPAPLPAWQRAVLQLPYPLVLSPQLGLPEEPFTAALERLPPGCSEGTLFLAVLGQVQGSALGEPDLGARLQWRLASSGRCVDIYPQLVADRRPPRAILLALDQTCREDPALPGMQDWLRLKASSDWLLADEQHLAALGTCTQIWTRDADLVAQLRAETAP